MSDENGARRHSEAEEASLITNEIEKAKREAANGLLQYDHAIEIIRHGLEVRPNFKLRVSHLLSSHRIAMDGLSSYAGVFRPGAVRITESQHEPPSAHLVPSLVEDMLDYVNEPDRKALHVAAYVMWRLNWIHPFADGNGRTSRILSYIALCSRLGYLLPGTKTIPDQISANRTPYYAALGTADRALREKSIVDVSAMETLLEELLAAQLVGVVAEAGGQING